MIRIVLLVLLLVPAMHEAHAADAARGPLVVFAAASLADVLQQVSAAFTKSTGVEVRQSFAASSALAKQIESGARADVFVSADHDWMDYLDGRMRIVPGSRTDLLGNRLALIAPLDSVAKLRLVPGAPVAAALGATGRLSIADPDSVPAGKYAKAALTNLHLWTAVQSRLARAENVRVALMYVARGEAPLGVVYATDVAVAHDVRIVDLFPESSHPPITYPAAVTTIASPHAAAYLSFLRSAVAREIFVRAGFTVIAAQGQKN